MWNTIIGQERVKRILKTMYSSGRIPHSFIFHGIEGTGKDATAIEFAKLINCDEPDAEKGSCGKCRNCRQINSLTSVNFRYIIALPSGRTESENGGDKADKDREDGDTISSELKKKISDPYYKISIPKAKTIKIESIRQIKNDIYYTVQKGKKKIFIISNAEQMSTEASNSFLKILEEPPGDALLILTTSKPNSLLPTITGRCQKIKFETLKGEELGKYIENKYPGISQEERTLLVNLSNGSLTTLKNIIENNFMALRDKVIDHLRAILADNFLMLSRIISELSADKDREFVRQYLNLMILWFRDLSVKKSGNDELLINRDKSENVANFINRFDCNEYEIINMLESFISDIDKNVNLELMLYTLSYDIRPLIRNLQ
jgi:DNA polymerase-3 subunit delta'